MKYSLLGKGLIALFIITRSSAFAGSLTFQDPVTVKLSDGRIVPYGPGVICEPSCEGATEPEGNNRKRVGIAVLVIGGILGSSLLLRSSSFVGGTSTASGPNPKPSEPPVSSIPEPGTLVLLGAGLLLVSRKLK